jgi:type IV secretory pathway protease TraF
VSLRLLYLIFVLKGHCYLLGDNRDDSCDSRYRGPLRLPGTLSIAAAVKMSGRRRAGQAAIGAPGRGQ